MNIRILLAVVLAFSAHVVQAKDLVEVRPEPYELPFLEVDASAAKSAADLFRRSAAMPGDPIAPMFALAHDKPAAGTQDLAVVQAGHTDLASEIQQTQYSFTSTASGDIVSAYSESCGDECGDLACCDPDNYPLFTGNVEIPFLRARISGAAPVFNVAPGAQRLIDPNYDPAIRYVAELRPEKSFGIRGRYFRFENTTGFDPPFQPAELSISLDTADLEFVFHHDTSRWNFDFSAGVEYSKLQYSADVATAVIGQGTATFEGVGPAFGINAEHKLGNSTFSFFGSARAAFLMGSIKNEALLINMPRAEIKDETAQVYQNQLGVIWQPELSDRVGVAVRAAWETQFWLNETFSDDSFGIGSNLSLTGPMVSAELSF